MKRGRSSHWIAFVMAFALVVALGVAVVLVRGVYLQRDQQEVMKEAAEPVGDEESDQYDWTGSYMDTMYLETTIAIESGLGGVYNVSITWGEQDSDDMSFWNCKASYDKAHRALVYKDAVRTNIVFPDTGDDDEDEASSSDELQTEDVYAGGSGFFYLRGGKIYWEDKNEDFGDGLQFEKI